ncbi:hypothetical protein C1Y63_08140 [Corynebacterium sp. 13CS0277]|uniref:hypothetical protein n=1 Tax=Corynebacterium sp. 13CS0277 TaxID=2071994 RepID=UPI000D03DD7F|nr:hypothetical protein [Corynebacterium sp. 13CS0277]PRQ11087.1 hypothetical protein C1Y63_08140 [Corynebacterium sp. 13CS0277]
MIPSGAPGGRGRTGVRAGALLAAAALCIGPWGAMPQGSARPTTPQSPTEEAVAETWANPLLRPAGQGAQIDVDALTVGGQSVTRMAPGQVGALTVTVRGAAHRDRDVAVQLGRADAVGTVADGRAALAADDDQFAAFGEPMPVAQQVAAGAETTVTLPLSLEALDITAPGVYPIMVALEAAGEDGPRVVDSERFLLTVSDTRDSSTLVGGAPRAAASALEAAGAANDTADDAVDSDAALPARITLLWPLAAATHITPGATGEAPDRAPLILQNEDLAAELAPGGRLDVLLRAYEEAVADPRVGTAACLALDPALLDTVERMTHGYTVSATRPSPVAEKLRLRDSWGQDAHAHAGRDGTGVGDAQRWLARVSLAARGGCSVALPWANADVNALAATGSSWLVREGISTGADTIVRTTGAQPVRTVVIPGTGFVDSHAVPAMTLVGESDVAGDWVASAAEAAGAGSERSALDDPTPPAAVGAAGLAGSAASVLVADNTVWGTPHDSATAILSPELGVTASLYPSSLAATLAQMGDNPVTVPYSNPATRFDYRRDSAESRRLDAAAALGLAAGAKAGENLIVVPPATLSGDADARTIFREVTDLIDSGVAEPQAAAAAMIPDAARLEGLQAPADPGTPVLMGSPFADPMSVTDLEIQRGAQQATYSDDLARLMVNDPKIALTPYLFIEPLLRDVVRAMSLQGRMSASTHVAATEEADSILNANRDMLQTLRGSVTLLPPGNVFTRTSDASPLPMVARNGLPLPVMASLRYAAPGGVEIGVPEEQLIPAKGSVTVMLPASVPDEDERIEISMWLATRAGAAISSPVELVVQTRSSMVKKGAAYAATVTVALLALGARFFIQRKRAREARAAARQQQD